MKRKYVSLRDKLASTRFDADEWVWYNDNKLNLNSKARARWNLAYQYADGILTLIRDEVKAVENPYAKPEWDLYRTYQKGFDVAVEKILEALE